MSVEHGFRCFSSVTECVSFRLRPICTSNIGNIGDKLNIGESVVSVCRYVIVTRRHAFNKPHSHEVVLSRRLTDKVKRGYVLATVVGLPDMTHMVQLRA